jgi:hypothetical protein
VVTNQGIDTMKNLPDEVYEAIRAFYGLETLEKAKEYHSKGALWP